MAEYGFEQRSFQANSIRVIVVALCLAVVCVWAIVLSPEHGGMLPPLYRKNLLIDFINVGQGDATLIRTPHGRNYLIDGGMSVPPAQAKNENRELVQNYLRKIGVRILDGVVTTHFHNDHLGGIVPVMKQMKIGRIWDPGGEFNSQTYKEYVELIQRKRIPRIPVKAGETIDWGEELSVIALHPAYISKAEGFSGLNNTSVTLLIRYGKFSLLMPGDIETDAQHEVARYGEALNSQVIKAPHHGSDTSIYRPFVDLVSPRYVVIMAGRGNPFGHPCQAMLDLYSQKGAQIYRTDHQGTIHLIVGGNDPKDFSFQVDRNT